MRHEDAVIQAILTLIPPPASDLNPGVSQTISRVVHKAMAKQPWNRFDTAREFGDTLQKAGLICYRGGEIKVLDRRALEAVACPCYQVLRDSYERLLVV